MMTISSLFNPLQNITAGTKQAYERD